MIQCMYMCDSVIQCVACAHARIPQQEGGMLASEAASDWHECFIPQRGQMLVGIHCAKMTELGVPCGNPVMILAVCATFPEFSRPFFLPRTVP